jgi:hypothetical protein
MTEYPRAESKVTSFILFYHLLEALPSENKPLMDEPV